MTKEQDKAGSDRLRHRLATFHRESLPPEEAVRHGTQELERRLSESSRKKYNERRKIAESLKTIYAPLAEIVAKDKHAVEEQRKLRQWLSQRTKPKLKTPGGPAARPMIASGSIYTVVPPPYDFKWEWVDPNTTGRAAAGADLSAGTFGGDAWSDEGPVPSGYGQAGAGFGLAFHPIEFQMLVIHYGLAYNVSWYENSNWDTAHTSGYSNIAIFQYDLNWAFQEVLKSDSGQIWSDGTSWLETHSGGTDVTESFIPPVYPPYFLSPNNNYMLWFYGTWEADGAGDPTGPTNSQARCFVEASLPYVALEQIF